MAMILETDRLQIREMTPDDYDDLCEILKDRDVMLTYDHPFSDAECLSWLSKQFLRYKRDGFGVWAVCDKKTGEFLGQCGVTTIALNGMKAYELGFLLKKRHWKNGYAAEAAIACKDYAFQVLKLDRLCSLIRVDNISAIALAEHIGMKSVHINKKQYWGAIMNEHVFVVAAGRSLE